MLHHARVRAAAALTTTVVLAMSGCAPPDPTTVEPDRSRATPAAHAPTPRLTDVFPDGKAVSAVRFWHDNPELVPEILDGSTLLLDAAGAGASTIPVPSASSETPLVLVLTCEHPIAYSLALVDQESAESFASTGGESCGGPTITVFCAPPVDLSGISAAIDVEVPEDTAYYLAVYRTAG